jgi:hypothetical protein
MQGPESRPGPPIQATPSSRYQPQIDSWQGHRPRPAPLSVNSPAQVLYGVIWITARTEVDKARSRPGDIKVTKASFPGFRARTTAAAHPPARPPVYVLASSR